MCLLQEQAAAMAELIETADACFKDKPDSFLLNESSQLDSIDVFGSVYGLFDEDDTRITDEQRKCIQVSQFFDNQ